jgi:hypothetical protein
MSGRFAEVFDAFGVHSRDAIVIALPTMMPFGRRSAGSTMPFGM